MVEEEKEKRSLNLLLVISKTIDRQVLGLATTIAWYNHHRSIVFPKDNLFEVTVAGLCYTRDLERLEDCYNKEEKYWKKFSEKSSEEVDQNEVGNFSSHSDEEESDSVKEISPPPKAFKKSLHMLEKEIEEEKLIFSQIGQKDVIWGKSDREISGKLKGKEVSANSNSSQLQLQPVQKFSGPRIRLTALKKVPNQFEKFTFSIPASSRSPRPIHTSSSGSSPIHAPDPHGKQVQSIFQACAATQPNLRGDPSKRCDPRLDPVHVTRDLFQSPAPDPGLFNTNSIRGSHPARNPVRDPRVSPLKRDPRLRTGPIRETDRVRVSSNVQSSFMQSQTRASQPFGPIRLFSNWVWTRNPNLGFSSPSEVRFGLFKRRYDQYSEEYYSGGYPNPHFRYKRCQRFGLCLDSVQDICCS